MPVVTVTGTLTCTSAEQADRVRTHLPEHIRLTRAEPGCLSFDVTPGADPMVWHVAEQFLDNAALEAHQTRTRASKWAGMTSDIARNFNVTEG
ncbi:MAG: antibiotic biosynthesis monooxygenase [Gemmobacter sp.]|nr:antibiotic biosynthesis monooxygenase [Gemmobacter sp.]